MLCTVVCTDIVLHVRYEKLTRLPCKLLYHGLVVLGHYVEVAEFQVSEPNFCFSSCA